MLPRAPLPAAVLRLPAMTMPGFALFDTAIGPCALAWREAGLVGVQLPEGSEAATRRQIARRFPDLEAREPAAAVRRARDAMTALLNGSASDLSNIALDMRDVTTFRRQVYDYARTIPRGATVTYGELAAGIGARGAARAVGRALGGNPFPIVVPCHRVLAAGGRSGGFSAKGGANTKMRMLAIEGAVPGGRDSAPRDGFEFDPDAAVAWLRAADPRLAKIIDRVGPFRMTVQETSTVFVALARAIVYQQLSGKAAGTIFGRVCRLMPRGQRGLTAANVMQLDDETLRGAGLSRNKLLALRDLSRRTLSGELPTLAKLRRMSDDDAVETLTAVRGIGRWTVEMLLITRLGRGDVLAVDDLGLRQGHAVIMGRRTPTAPRALAAYGERWRPYRTVASWYLWRAAELGR